MAGGTIQYKVGYSVDRTGLNQLKTSLTDVKNIANQALSGIKSDQITLADNKLREVIVTANQLDAALESAFNTNLGVLNISKFNQALKTIDIAGFTDKINQMGATAQNSFRNFTTGILTTNLQLKQTHSFLNDMAETMGNTIKWGIASSALNNFTGSINKAYSYVRDLDTSLNNIMIVTEKSAEQMKSFAKQANYAAKELGASTTAYTDAALIYYQQGLGDTDVAARAEVTLKAANVTKQSAEEVSEQLTAVWNGYKVSAQEAESYIDKLAAVAASTASDLEELSTGMSKVASAANSMGVDVDQLNAQLATIVSVTRQAPESVGTALKTIYARMGDLAVDGEDEFGVKLGEVSGKMEQMGIQILDQQGELRNMGIVIEETAEKWNSWTEAQKQAAAVAIAGKRQYNNLIALFENWDMYEDALKTSQNSLGTLSQQQDDYMQSIEAHLKQMQTASQDLYASLMNADGLNPMIDSLTGLIKLLGNFASSMGGLGPMMLMIGTIGANVFSKQIANSLATTIENFRIAQENAAKLQAQLEMTQLIKDNSNLDEERFNNLIRMAEERNNLAKSLTEEERNTANELIKQTNELYKQRDSLEERLQSAAQLNTQLTGEMFNVQTQQGRDSTLISLQNELTQFEDYATFANNAAVAEAALRRELQSRGAASTQAQEITSRYTEALDAQAVTAEELINLDKLSLSARQELSEALNKYNQALGENGQFQASNNTHVEAAKEFNATYAKIVQEVIQQLRQGTNILNTYNKKVEENEHNVQAASDAWQSFKKHINLKDNIQGVVKFTSGLGQMAMVLNSLTRMKDIFEDKDLSTMDKITQLVMSQSMAVSSLVFGWKGLKEGIGALGSIFKGANKWLTDLTDATLNAGTKEKLLNLAKKEGIAVNQELTTAEIQKQVVDELTQRNYERQIALTKANNIELTEEQLLEEKQQATTVTNLLLQKQEIAQDEIETVTSKKKTAQLWAEVTAKMAKNWYILLIVTALAALAAITYAVIKAENKEKDALEATQKATKDLTDSLTELKSAYEELENSFSDFEKGQLALQNMKKYTDEWTAAVQENNEKVLELINRYQELANYVTVDEDGVMTLSAEGMHLVLDNEREEVTKMQSATYASQKQENERENIVNREEFIDKTYFYNIADQYASLAYSDTSKIQEQYGDNYIGNLAARADGFASAYLARVVDEIKKIEASKTDEERAQGSTKETDWMQDTEQLKKIAGTDNEYILKLIQSNTEQMKALSGVAGYTTDGSQKITDANDAIDRLVTEINENGTSFLTDIDKIQEIAGVKNEAWARTIQDNTGALIELAKSVDANTKANSLIDKEMASNFLSENYAGYEKLGYAESLERVVANSADDYYDSSYNSVKSSDKLSTIFDDSGLHRKYAEMFLPEDAVYEDDKWGKAEFTVGDKTLTLSDEDMRAAIAQQVALARVDVMAISQTLSSIASQGKAGGLGQGLSMTESDELGAMFASDLSGGEGFKTMTEAQHKALASSLENGSINIDLLDEETLKLQGYKDGQAYLDHLQEVVDNYNPEEAAAERAKKEQAEFNSIIEAGASELEMSSTALEGYAEHLLETHEGLEDNKKAAAQMAVAHAKFSKGADKLRESLDDNIDILQEWDTEALETYEAASQVQEALKDMFGVEVSADFVKEHLSDIKAVAEGDIEALDRLSVAMAKDYVTNLTIEESAKDEINDFIDKLTSQDFEIGANFNSDEAITKMNELLAEGKISADELNAAFATVGYQPDIQYTSEPGPETVTNTTTDIDGNIYGIPIKGSVTTSAVSSSMVEVPYIAAEGTQRDANVKEGKGARNSGKGFTKIATPKTLGGSLSSKIKDTKVGEDKNKKDIEFLEDEKDLYHDINIEIQKLENSMEKLQSQQDKLYGQDLLNNLQKQLDLLERQEDAQRRKLEIAKQEANSLKSTLEKQGTKFNADGTIANYQSLYDQKLAYVNRVIASGDEEAAEAAKKEFEAWLESVERYDELISNEIPEIDQAIRDKINERIEKQIEAFEYKITLKLEVKDAERDWNDFKKEMLEDDDILGRAGLNLETFKTYLGDEGTINTLTEKSNTLLDQLKQINETGTSSIYGDNKAKLMEDLKAVQEELMSAMKDQKDILKEIEQAYFDMLDAAQEAFDEQIAQYEAINEVYSHGLNVINLLYGEDAYAEMEDFYQKQMENNTQMIDMQKKTVDYYKGLLQNASLSDDERKEVQKRLQEAQAALHSSVESQIELIITKYQNAINKIFKTLEDKMSGGKGLSYIQEEWDLINQNAEMYLDEVNSAYEIEKLSREYNKAIDATDNLSAQRKLNELMEQQLKGLREKDKLTQYEVDRANALLDIELKRIALEEAQQNKSKMRLRRDASGNYSYQFVSDEDSVAQAQQELADAQNSLYNLDKDALQENQEAALNMWTEFKDKYMEIMSDVTLSDEEREARLQLIREQYGEMYNNLLMQNADIRKNLEETALEEMAQMNLDYTMEQIVPTWNSGVQQMMESFAGEGGLIPACSEAFGELTEITNQYAADLGVLEATAGYNLGNIAGYTTEVITEMTTVLSNNEELIAKYEEQHRQLELIRDTVTGLMGDYETLAANANAAADAIIRAREEEARSNPENNPPEDNGDGGDRPKDDGDNKNPVDNSSKVEGVAAAIWLDPNYAGWGSGATRASRLSSKGVAAAQSIIDSKGPNGQLYRKWWKKDRSGYKFGAFDTGGYTGDWTGNDGRVALLHKKELVLNDKDTKNILQAVDVVRQIDGIMSSIMGNAFAKVNNQINGLNSMSFPVGGPTSSEAAVAQHIEINADFPGVEKASEIISAFENLTNMATQYAFKTDR